MSFQVANSRGRNFLNLLDNDLKPIIPLTIKDGPWLQYFGLSNSLCARATSVKIVDGGLYFLLSLYFLFIFYFLFFYTGLGRIK